MRTAFLVAVFGGAVLLPGCKSRPAEVDILETRELTTEDHAPKLNATSAERFLGARAPRSYRHELPDGWSERPASMLRKLNFAIGPEGEGEVYLSETQGDVASNLNRWRGQFGLEALPPSEIEKLPSVPALGGGMSMLRLSGTYSPGMGRPDREGFALAGAIGVRDGMVITIKMVGPEELVAAEAERFESFLGSLGPGE
jgi:hypothetical protein